MNVKNLHAAQRLFRLSQKNNKRPTANVKCIRNHHLLEPCSSLILHQDRQFTSATTRKATNLKRARISSLPRRNFAIYVNVGQGKKAEPTKDPNYDNLDPASQRKGALLTLDRVTNSTNGFLNMDVSSLKRNEIETLANDMRAALNYWSYTWIVHHHPFSTIHPTHVQGLRYQGDDDQAKEENFGDYGPKQAEKILEVIKKIDQTHPGCNFIDKVIGIDGNAPFANIISAYLLPCSASGDDTYQQDDVIFYSSTTGTRNVNAAVWRPAIRDAARIMDIMNEMVEDNNNGLQFDTHGNNALLYIWVKLGILLDLDSSSGFDVTDGASTLLTLESAVKVAKAMEDKLQKMEQRYFASGEESVKPDIFSYNHVLRGLVLMGDSASDRIQWYLRRMEQTEDVALGVIHNLNDEVGQDVLPPTTAFADSIPYNMAINAVTSNVDRQTNPRLKAKMAVKMAEAANSILLRMEERYRRNNRDEAQPTAITYSSVLKAWAIAQRPEEAERVLKRMMSLSEDPSNKFSASKPNLICFNTVIAAWSNTRGKKSAENALAILDQMEELSENGDYPEARPDTITYSSVISAFSRSGRIDAGDRAEELLERSISLFHGGREDVKPDSMTFSAVLLALSKQGQLRQSRSEDYQSIEIRAENIFNRMNEISESRDWRNNYSYNIMLGMYAYLGRVKKTEDLFQQMCDAYNSGNKNVKPDILSYNNLLYALASSSSSRDFDKAKEILNGMEQKRHKDCDDVDIDIEPNETSYHHVMRALAKRSKYDHTAIREIEEMIDSIEDRYKKGESSIKPIILYFNDLIDALAKSGSKDVFTRGRKILNRMAELSTELNDWALKPDVTSYTSLINGISKTRSFDAPLQAQTLLDEMQENGVRPNARTYNSYINCVARSRRRDAGERAEEILMEMKDLSDSGNVEVRPNSFTFASVINCWAQSKEKHSAERAERILNLLERESAKGDEGLKATIPAYGSVVHAWSRSGAVEAPEKSLQILQRMEEKGTQPNKIIFNSVIATIAKGTSPTKAQDAEAVLGRMIESHKNGNLHAEPDFRAFSTVLNACAFTKTDGPGKMAAFKIARRVFKEILSEKYGHPSDTTFSTFLLACQRLVPNGMKRDQLIESVFKESCRYGLVNQRAVEIVVSTLSGRKLHELFEGTNLPTSYANFDSGDIPIEWRKNISSRGFSAKPKRNFRERASQ